MSEEAKPVCGHCMREIAKSETGVRHYGLHSAHAEHRCIYILDAEITALRAAIAEKDAAWLREKESAHHWRQDAERYAREHAVLDAALDQERADNERLRAFARDVAIMHGKDEDVASRLRAYDLMDVAGNPTALLSGRGEVRP